MTRSDNSFFNYLDSEPYQKMHCTIRGSPYVDKSQPIVQIPLQKSYKQVKQEDGTALDCFTTFDDTVPSHFHSVPFIFPCVEINLFHT